MIPARGLPRLGPEPLPGQEQLFLPTAPEPPSFDEMCPPFGLDQLEVDGAIPATADPATCLEGRVNHLGRSCNRGEAPAPAAMRRQLRVALVIAR